MNVRLFEDDELMCWLTMCANLMEQDSEIADISLEFENGDEVGYPELLAEAARRAEKQ